MGYDYEKRDCYKNTILGRLTEASHSVRAGKRLFRLCEGTNDLGTKFLETLAYLEKKYASVGITYGSFGKFIENHVNIVCSSVNKLDILLSLYSQLQLDEYILINYPELLAYKVSVKKMYLVIKSLKNEAYDNEGYIEEIKKRIVLEEIAELSTEVRLSCMTPIVNEYLEKEKIKEQNKR